MVVPEVQEVVAEEVGVAGVREEGVLPEEEPLLWPMIPIRG